MTPQDYLRAEYIKARVAHRRAMLAFYGSSFDPMAEHVTAIQRGPENSVLRRAWQAMQNADTAYHKAISHTVGA